MKEKFNDCVKKKYYQKVIVGGPRGQADSVSALRAREWCITYRFESCPLGMERLGFFRHPILVVGPPLERFGISLLPGGLCGMHRLSPLE